MSDLTPLFALAAVLAATLATVSVWSPRRLPVKAGALVVAFALMGTAYAAMLDLLSKPKPASFEWWLDQGRRGDRARQLDGRGPGDLSLAAARRRQASRGPTSCPGTGAPPSSCRRRRARRPSSRPRLRMRLPFEKTLDDREPRFYALPQPALPPKDAPAPAGRIVPPPGTDA